MSGGGHAPAAVLSENQKHTQKTGMWIGINMLELMAIDGWAWTGHGMQLQGGTTVDVALVTTSTCNLSLLTTFLIYVALIV